MPQFFLRVEGVNLASVLDDTDDLSTRRGGGLMLLNAPQQLEAVLAPHATNLATVSTGASVGLYRFEAEEADLNRIESVARRHLRNATPGPAPLRHGTFVVDTVPAAGNPAEALQLAMAKNRWRQLREPAVSLDGLWDARGGPSDACHYDRVRPAVRGCRAPKDPGHDISQSVSDRRTYGRAAKQEFYPEVGGRELVFANEFSEISHHKTPPPESALLANHDKLAVFYVDGNQFGDTGRAILAREGVTAYRDWSRQIREHHDSVLKSLLTHMSRDPEWSNRDAIRLETLLWGGDEIVWVVPAWKGWELAELFFRESTARKPELTYAGGLVFCHTKAPIANIVKLARRLVAVAKGAGKGKHRLAYEVLEAFDDITSDLADHRAKWLPPALKSDPAALVLDPTNLPDLIGSMRTIAGNDDFPTRQLYRLNKLWRAGENYDACVARLTAEGLRAPVEAVREAFDDQPVAWLHLLQMLPYLSTPTAVAL